MEVCLPRDVAPPTAGFLVLSDSKRLRPICCGPACNNSRTLLGMRKITDAGIEAAQFGRGA